MIDKENAILISIHEKTLIRGTIRANDEEYQFIIDAFSFNIMNATNNYLKYTKVLTFIVTVLSAIVIYYSEYFVKDMNSIIGLIVLVILSIPINIVSKSTANVNNEISFKPDQIWSNNGLRYMMDNSRLAITSTNYITLTGILDKYNLNEKEYRLGLSQFIKYLTDIIYSGVILAISVFFAASPSLFNLSNYSTYIFIGAISFMGIIAYFFTNAILKSIDNRINTIINGILYDCKQFQQ